MADLTISFQFKEGDIQYALDRGEFQPLEEDTVIGVDFGAKVTFEAKTDIRKIINIIVNLQKGAAGKFGEIWAESPRQVSETSWVGKTLDPFEGQRFNSWTIQYETSGGEAREKDPTVKMPPTP